MKMKNFTAKLKWINPDYGWHLVINRITIGRLCYNETKRVLQLKPTQDYTLTIRQQQTRCHATLKLWTQVDFSNIWNWHNLSEPVTRLNLFLNDEIDNFITRKFGNHYQSNPVWLRIKVTPIDNIV